MAPNNSIHSRSHSLLLLQKLLNLRDGASPLTLLIDSLEQPAKPLLAEFISRAKVSFTFTSIHYFHLLLKSSLAPRTHPPCLPPGVLVHTSLTWFL